MTTLWAGLAAGAIYSIIAIGYNITLLTAGVLNFAFAHILMFGAFMGWAGSVAWGLPVIPTVLISMAACAALAVLEERVAIRPLAVGEQGELITTVGFATAVTGVCVLVWGSDPLAVPVVSDRSLTVLGGRLVVVDIILVIAAILLAVGLQLWATRSRLGLASLALAENRDAATLRGVNVRTLSIGAFLFAGLVAGLLGPFIGAKIFASAFTALLLAIKGFIALTLGGVGSQSGALVGGFAVGLIEAVAQYQFGVKFGGVAVFAVFLVVLLARPTGLFGHRTSRTV